MNHDNVIHIYRTWTSEFIVTALFLISIAISIPLTNSIPETVLVGDLFNFGSTTYYLKLPLLWLPPFFILAYGVFGIYNTRYVLDGEGVYSKEGILSVSQRSYRIRYEDIKSIELNQGVLGRILNFGDILIGSAALGTVEIKLLGVGSPEEIQEMILNERDRTQKLDVEEYEKVIDNEIQNELSEREAFKRKMAEAGGAR